MWKQPGRLFDWWAEFFWINREGISRLEGIEWFARDPEASQLLQHLVEELIRIVRRHVADAGVNARFKRELRHLFLPVARQIEESRNWNLVARLFSELDSLSLEGIEYPILVALPSLVILQLLVGTEHQLLVGTRANRAAWQKTEVGTGAFRQCVECQPGSWLKYIEQADTELLPRLRQQIAPPSDYDWPHVDFSRAKALFEEAYYNRRYIVHPQGAEVRLQHFGPIKSLKLKVKPSVSDPNYSDFLAVFEVDQALAQSGDTSEPRYFVLVLDGSWITSEVLPEARTSEQERFMFYFSWVIAVIYHDLVTAETIRVVRQESETQNAIWPSDAELPEPSWVYIPRKVKEGVTEPRIQLPSPRIMMPHHVTGHLRKGNLTDQHREELEKFERQTGLRVLDMLDNNPGYTFVRPHVSPSVEGLSELPRFIHARLQSDIERMMRKPLA